MRESADIQRQEDLSGRYVGFHAAKWMAVFAEVQNFSALSDYFQPPPSPLIRYFHCYSLQPLHNSTFQEAINFT